MGPLRRRRRQPGGHGVHRPGAQGPPGRLSERAATAPAQLLSRLSVSQTRIAAILAGGAIGTLARAGMAEAIPSHAGRWPWGTFAVNLAGAFILGWLLTRLAERTAPTRHWRFFAGTGFCGALTTFSTFEVETLQFARHSHLWLAFAYPVASIAAGMALAGAGVIAARWGRHW